MRNSARTFDAKQEWPKVFSNLERGISTSSLTNELRGRPWAFRPSFPAPQVITAVVVSEQSTTASRRGRVMDATASVPAGMNDSEKSSSHGVAGRPDVAPSLYHWELVFPTRAVPLSSQNVNHPHYSKEAQNKTPDPCTIRVSYPREKGGSSGAREVRQDATVAELRTSWWALRTPESASEVEKGSRLGMGTSSSPSFSPAELEEQLSLQIASALRSSGAATTEVLSLSLGAPPADPPGRDATRKTSNAPPMVTRVVEHLFHSSPQPSRVALSIVEVEVCAKEIVCTDLLSGKSEGQPFPSAPETPAGESGVFGHRTTDIPSALYVALQEAAEVHTVRRAALRLRDFRATDKRVESSAESAGHLLLTVLVEFPAAGGDGTVAPIGIWRVWERAPANHQTRGEHPCCLLVAPVPAGDRHGTKEEGGIGDYVRGVAFGCATLTTVVGNLQAPPYAGDAMQPQQEVKDTMSRAAALHQKEAVQARLVEFLSQWSTAAVESGAEPCDTSRLRCREENGEAARLILDGFALSTAAYLDLQVELLCRGASRPGGLPTPPSALPLSQSTAVEGDTKPKAEVGGDSDGVGLPAPSFAEEVRRVRRRMEALRMPLVPWRPLEGTLSAAEERKTRKRKKRDTRGEPSEGHYGPQSHFVSVRTAEKEEEEEHRHQSQWRPCYEHHYYYYCGEERRSASSKHLKSHHHHRHQRGKTVKDHPLRSRSPSLKQLEEKKQAEGEPPQQECVPQASQTPRGLRHALQLRSTELTSDKKTQPPESNGESRVEETGKGIGEETALLLCSPSSCTVSRSTEQENPSLRKRTSSLPPSDSRVTTRTPARPPPALTEKAHCLQGFAMNEREEGMDGTSWTEGSSDGAAVRRVVAGGPRSTCSSAVRCSRRVDQRDDVTVGCYSPPSPNVKDLPEGVRSASSSPSTRGSSPLPPPQVSVASPSGAPGRSPTLADWSSAAWRSSHVAAIRSFSSFYEEVNQREAQLSHRVAPTPAPPPPRVRSDEGDWGSAGPSTSTRTRPTLEEVTLDGHTRGMIPWPASPEGGTAAQSVCALTQRSGKLAPRESSSSDSGAVPTLRGVSPGPAPPPSSFSTPPPPGRGFPPSPRKGAAALWTSEDPSPPSPIGQDSTEVLLHGWARTPAAPLLANEASSPGGDRREEETGPTTATLLDPPLVCWEGSETPLDAKDAQPFLALWEKVVGYTEEEKTKKEETPKSEDSAAPPSDGNSVDFFAHVFQSEVASIRERFSREAKERELGMKEGTGSLMATARPTVVGKPLLPSSTAKAVEKNSKSVPADGPFQAVKRTESEQQKLSAVVTRTEVVAPRIAVSKESAVFSHYHTVTRPKVEQLLHN